MVPNRAAASTQKTDAIVGIRHKTRPEEWVNTGMRPVLPLLLVTLAWADSATVSVTSATRSGMDADGRIPKRVLPADLDHPERWRYLPEARVVPGPPWERLFVTAFPVPIIYFQEAVGFGGGIGLVDTDFRNQRRAEFLGLFAARSTQGQEKYAIVWGRSLAHRELPDGGVLLEERADLRAKIGYERNLTRRFFGLGPDTTASDEASYTDETSEAELGIQHPLDRFGGFWIGQAAIRGRHRNLFTGQVEDKPDALTRDYATLSSADHHDALWTIVGLRWDSRDSAANPYTGIAIGVTYEAAPVQTADAAGGIATVRVSYALPLPGLFHDGGAEDLRSKGPEENPPTDVLAIGGFVAASHDTLTAPDLPALGGEDTLRGYLADRFTDRNAWHASAEWRVWVLARGFRITDRVRFERLGIAPFVDLGSVAPRLGDLASASVHHSIGIGTRLMIERAATMRLDIARSPEQTGVNFTFGMPF